MRAKDEVSAALQGPAPCDRCSHRSDCRSEKLARLNFQRWVNTGALRHQEFREPKHRIYRMVFRGELSSRQKRTGKIL
jgi:hypothetical protein